MSRCVRERLSESQIAELCKKLYARHKTALDLIYEHRPDRVRHVREYLEVEISKNDQLVLDHCSKSYIRFVAKKLDVAVLKKGAGSTPGGRMLLFEVENLDGWLVEADYRSRPQRAYKSFSNWRNANRSRVRQNSTRNGR